ncbi:unnamed protein product, partial [Heterotrigona itama]
MLLIICYPSSKISYFIDEILNPYFSINWPSMILIRYTLERQDAFQRKFHIRQTKSDRERQRGRERWIDRQIYSWYTYAFLQVQARGRKDDLRPTKPVKRKWQSVIPPL